MQEKENCRITFLFPAFLLDRPRLFPLLDTGREGPLTLLSAPAGFGKTTLASQWLAARRASADFPPVTWVSLEVSDNDLLRFWRYLIAACQAFRANLTEAHRAFAVLTPQPPFLPADLSGLLTVLLNILARVQQRYRKLHKEELINQLLLAQQQHAQLHERWLALNDHVLEWQLRVEQAESQFAQLGQKPAAPADGRTSEQNEPKKRSQ